MPNAPILVDLAPRLPAPLACANEPLDESWEDMDAEALLLEVSRLIERLGE